MKEIIMGTKKRTPAVIFRKSVYMYTLSAGRALRTSLLLLLMLVNFQLSAQTPVNKAIPSGSFIINMGIVPQTLNNGLKPYGLVFELLRNKVPVNWVLNTAKSKDGLDFTYRGKDYKGAPFIIEEQYLTPAIKTIIGNWITANAVGMDIDTTTLPLTVPVYLTFQTLPKWTMDLQNGGIAVNFFTNAGITGTNAILAYGGSAKTGWKLPSALNCCDDIFVMPHADPIWSTHRHLYDWVQAVGNGTNTGCKSGVWLGCHSGSALEDMFDNITTDGDPIDYNQQTNFLSAKTGPATGGGPWSQNALVLWGDHDDGTLPYSYDWHGEPIMQFMGTLDAATQNGSEQIYIPLAPGWYPNTHVGVYDPDHPNRYPGIAPYTGYIDPKHRAAVLAYGPAFGVPGNGKIMMEASHNISGTAPANVAAQRAFFNYSYLVSWEKAVIPTITGIPDTVYSGQSYPLSYNTTANVPPTPLQTYTTTWSASCAGTWNPNNTSATTTFIPGTVSSPTACNISVVIVDACGRTTFDTKKAVVMPCKLTITPTVTQPSCSGNSNGSISMAITGGAAPYSWTWNRTNPVGGPTNGTGTNITGLSAGTYAVTVTDANNCTGTFTSLVSQPASLSVTSSQVNVGCFGQSTGSINITVSGGTAPYTYNWTDITTAPEPEDRTNLAAGTYTVTVTDAAGCTSAPLSVTITQPAAALGLSAVATNVTCNGLGNGNINLTVTGGTAPYTYLWSNGATTEDISGLVPGTYSVTVTDANGCTATLSRGITQPNPLTLTVSAVNPTCAALNPPAYSTFDGSITLSVSGGTGPFTFNWDDLTTPPEPQNRANLGPGTYNVTVTDANGCTKSASVTLAATSASPTAPVIIYH